MSRSLRTRLCALIFLVLGPASLPLSADERVFYTGSDFSVTEEDLRRYLQFEKAQAVTGEWGSPARVQQALTELYVLKSLARHADDRNLLGDENAAWIAYYQVALEKARRLIASEVERNLDQVDWTAEARAYYLAHGPEFVRRETVTVRALLLKAESRSLLEALQMATDLVPANATVEQFTEIVIAHSEDPSGGDGLLEEVKKGQTVPEFEAAAFALDDAGDISEPVVSRFGVHVIQLLEKTPESPLPFDAVEERIVAALKEKRAVEFANVVRSSPLLDPPADVVIHQEQIDAFLRSVDAEYEQTQLDSLNR